MVPGVQAYNRPLTEGGDLSVGGAPIRNVRVVERGLEELVLEHQALVLADAGVDLGERLREVVLTAAEVVLPGVVGAVGEPDLEIA
ncbi:hypothetical protein GCM10011600_29200 [Pseudolysinimonas yzui]|uniref:Uncharacterized protein n=1 Tax=Pseudolysinimonas yzui TaxID=2708254 RepID=A0A8J3GSN3_9MICO|nr:hypothetical protein GCM10011600_29200 [Pseudolysinimonas yzui]